MDGLSKRAWGYLTPTRIQFHSIVSTGLLTQPRTLAFSHNLPYCPSHTFLLTLLLNSVAIPLTSISGAMGCLDPICSPIQPPAY